MNEDILKTEKKKIVEMNKEKKRNYGIDLLRIISMIHVLILHLLLYTNDHKINKNSKKYRIIWFLEISSIWCVNCFALISGVVGYKNYKFSNLIYLWFQIFFYSFPIEIISYKINKKKSSKKNIIDSLFPIMINRHWYFNAYFIMYLFIPFFNEGIKNLKRKTLRNIIIFFIFFFSIYDMIRILKRKSEYHSLKNGYSSLWLSILYIIGAYFGKYLIESENKITKIYFIKWISIYLILTFSTWKLHLFLLYKKNLDFKVLLFKKYPFPIVLFQAICLLMIFSKLKINNCLIKRIISFFTPHVFGVLLFHSRILHLKTHFLKNFFLSFQKIHSDYLFCATFFWAVFFFVLCSFVDYFRLLTFKLFKIKDFCIQLENKIPKLIDNILIILGLEKKIMKYN